MLRHAEDLLGRAHAVEQELAALGGGEIGTLRIGGFATAWGTFLPPAVASFSRAHPSVQLELDQLEPDPALRALRAGELDLAVVYRFGDTATPAEADDRFEWQHLFDDPYAVVLPAGHGLASRRRLRVDDLAGEQWVSPPASAPYTRCCSGSTRSTAASRPPDPRDAGHLDGAAADSRRAGRRAAPGPEPGQRHPSVEIRSLPDTPVARSVWVVRRSQLRTPSAPPMIAALDAAAGELRLAFG